MTEYIQIILHNTATDEPVDHRPLVWTAVPPADDFVQWTELSTGNLMQGRVVQKVWGEGTRYCASERTGQPGFSAAKVVVELDLIRVIRKKDNG